MEVEETISMYLSAEIILRALEELEGFHPFYGITFLLFKKHEIPIGTTKKISIDLLERAFMDEYYKPFEESAWYYRVFRPNNPNKRWLDLKYPGSSLQNTRTRGAMAQALIYDASEPSFWGWKENYVEVLAGRLYKGKKISALYLAVWLYRQRQWDNNVTPQDIIDTFIDEFNITDDEIKHLFDTTIPSNLNKNSVFNVEPVQINDLIPKVGIPPDLPGEGGGILSYLELKGVGPAEKLVFEPGRRINLITGDNGLGKTFLLDISWWALTGQWLDYPADPTNTLSKQAKISYRVAGEYKESETITIEHDRSAFSWPTPNESKAEPCLLVYARADNSFAIWDPAQHSAQVSGQISSSQPYIFSPDDVWFGLEDKFSRRSICEGLLRDWVNWQSTQAKEFDELTQILKRLSPKDLGELRPGQPTRVPNEKRPIPTLSLPYSDVAVIYASAGMRRIISLAYLLVWAWSEHKVASEQAGQEQQRRMVILIDEIEAHLHPKWQRLILPALVDVHSELSQELDVQFLIATHSPFVTVSVEPVFDVDTDKIFNLDFVQKDVMSSTVLLKELPFIKFGVIDSWLADVFGVKQPRYNISGGTALEDAKQLQLQDDPDPQHIREVHNRLVKYLAPDDEFWPRWLFFAEEHGVET